MKATGLTRAGSMSRAAAAAVLVVFLTLASPALPARAQTVGGLGQRGRGGDDNAPRPVAPPAPEPPKPDPPKPDPPKPDPPKPDPPKPDPPKPDPPKQEDLPPAPAPPPPAPEPPPAPAPEPPPAAAPAPPPAPQREARPVPPPVSSDTPPAGREAPRRGESVDAEASPARSVRVTTPIGQRPVPRPNNDGDYLYAPPVFVEVPVPVEYPVPADAPDVPVYTTLPQPFPPPQSAPQSATADRPAAPESEPGPAVRPPAPTYPAAFADIERAWAGRNPALIGRHVRTGTKIAVSLRGRYAYSLLSTDFLRITRTALRRLVTVSFRFTRLRRVTNGDVTAYGRHIYRVPAKNQKTNARGPAPSAGMTASPPKTVYVSYTLHRQGSVWSIVAIDSAPAPLVK